MFKAIRFDRMIPPEAAEYDVLWYTLNQAIPELTEQQIVTIISLMVDVCHNCFENDSGCQCWNDE